MDANELRLESMENIQMDQTRAADQTSSMMMNSEDRPKTLLKSKTSGRAYLDPNQSTNRVGINLNLSPGNLNPANAAYSTALPTIN